MNSTFKKIMSLILVVVMLCCPFMNIAQQAQAVGPGAALLEEFGPELLSLLLLLLSAAGITFGTKGEAVQAAAQWYRDNIPMQNIVNGLKIGLTTNPQLGLQSMKLTLDAALYLQFIKLVQSVKEYFSRAKETINIVNLSDTYVQGNPFVTTLSGLTNQQVFSLAHTPISTPVNYKVNNVAYTYIMSEVITSSKDHIFELKLNDKSLCVPYVGNSVTSSILMTPTKDYSSITGGFGFTNSPTFPGYLIPFVAQRMVSKLGVVSYSYAIVDNYCEKAKGAYFPYAAEEVTYGTDPLDYGYDIDYSDSDYYNALEIVKDRLAANGMTMDISLAGEYGDVQEGTGEGTADKTYIARWAAILTSLGILDLVRTLKQNTTVKERDLDTPKMPVDIKDKFPFCVPFDLIALVTALNAPAVVPSATIPIKFSALHYESSMTIDLAQFEGVAKAVRWGMTILYLFGLTILTRKLIKG